MSPEFTLRVKCTRCRNNFLSIEGGRGGGGGCGTLYDQKLLLSVSYEIFFMHHSYFFKLN